MAEERETMSSELVETVVAEPIETKQETDLYCSGQVSLGHMVDKATFGPYPTDRYPTMLEALGGDHDRSAWLLSAVEIVSPKGDRRPMTLIQSGPGLFATFSDVLRAGYRIEMRAMTHSWVVYTKLSVKMHFTLPLGITEAFPPALPEKTPEETPPT